jgi:hypothetical protein
MRGVPNASTPGVNRQVVSGNFTRHRAQVAPSEIHPGDFLVPKKSTGVLWRTLETHRRENTTLMAILLGYHFGSDHCRRSMTRWLDERPRSLLVATAILGLAAWHSAFSTGSTAATRRTGYSTCENLAAEWPGRSASPATG